MSQIWVNIYLPLWISGQMTIDQLQLASSKERITPDEYEYIVSQPQVGISDFK
jgi:hypothetical protein